MSTSNFKEGQIVLIDLKGAAGVEIDVEIDGCLGEVINVGEDGMIVLALGTVKKRYAPGLYRSPFQTFKTARQLMSTPLIESTNAKTADQPDPKMQERWRYYWYVIRKVAQEIWDRKEKQ